MKCPYCGVEIETDTAKCSSCGTWIAVRSGHRKAISTMAQAEFRDIKELFEQHSSPGGVYFRPTNNGIVPVDLQLGGEHLTLGIGETIRLSDSKLTISMDERIKSFKVKLDKRIKQSKKPDAVYLEKQYEANLMYFAQTKGLHLPKGFLDSSRFINSQWRIPYDKRKCLVSDIITVSTKESTLDIIELKLNKDDALLIGKPEVLKYLELFKKHKIELLPFFLDVAKSMNKLYGCPELKELKGFKFIRAFVAYPTDESKRDSFLIPVDSIKLTLGSMKC